MSRPRNRRLAMESAVIVRPADRLAVRLRRGDPLAGRVALSKGDFFVCGVGGAFEGLFARHGGRGQNSRAAST